MALRRPEVLRSSTGGSGHRRPQHTRWRIPATSASLLWPSTTPGTHGTALRRCVEPRLPGTRGGLWRGSRAAWRLIVKRPSRKTKAAGYPAAGFCLLPTSRAPCLARCAISARRDHTLGGLNWHGRIVQQAIKFIKLPGLFGVRQFDRIKSGSARVSPRRRPPAGPKGTRSSRQRPEFGLRVSNRRPWTGPRQWRTHPSR